MRMGNLLIYSHERVVVALTNLPHRHGAVFPQPDGLPYERPKRPDDTSAGSRIKKAFAGACRRAGIDGFSAHGCPHTWATWHYAANRDVSALIPRLAVRDLPALDV